MTEEKKLTRFSAAARPTRVSPAPPMTIDSTWLVSFKEDVPCAFTPAAPHRHSAVFVDGQIKLMQAAPREPMTWDEFIHRQFARHLSRHLEHCDTVILAFDNYAEVPRAKAMTQLKRRRPIPACPLEDGAELPCMVPEGELWTQCISSRAFKARVVELVLLRLPHVLLVGRPGKRLVVDYTRPVEHSFEPGVGMRRAELADLEPLGEADVKFPRYAAMHGSLMVDSIDGDSVAIALRHHELCVRHGASPPRVSVFRLELKTSDSKGEPKPDPKPEDKKRKRPPPRTYEYVDIPALYQGLMVAVAQSVGRVLLPSHRGHEMAMLLALVGLTGTDFSRGLPLLSGRALFSYLPDLWGTLAAVYDPACEALAVDGAADRLVGLVYRTKYQNHAKARGLPAVLDELRASKLSQRVKDSLPSRARVACTVRNTNWLLAYWTCARPPDPLQPAYGFRLGASGRPEYDDAE